MPKGKLFVIDGTDGTGKETQTDRLSKRLLAEGYPAGSVSFPRYDTPTGRVVRMYLDGKLGTIKEVSSKLASILYAEDRYAAKPELEARLERGENIVANRYAASNMGHQGAKISDPALRREFFLWNDELEFGIFGLPRPDLNIVLHVPAAIGQKLAAKRGRGSDIHENDLGHLQAAEQTYLEIAGMFPGFRLVECVENGELLSREAIHEKVWAIIKPLLTT